ncbi:MAG: PD-(D/E)XK nuclease family protein [Planctomycetes bacterium]|nr:PD-(D/E)XK nuclease family protein [Planctomycetota bacterium]
METRILTQLSPSKLTAYMTCPIKFYARYILGIKSPASAGMLLGRAVQSHRINQQPLEAAT